MIHQAIKWRSEDSGENYLASVSDLMSGLVFVFILTLLVFALQMKDTEARLKDTEVEHQQALNYLTNSDTIRKEILEKIESALLREGVRVTVDLDKGIIHVPEAILFPLGSAELRPEGERALASLAKVMIEVLPQYAGSVPAQTGPTDKRGRLDAVFIEGHTDDIPISNARFPDNWTLSTARAIRTYQTLTSRHPEIDDLENFDGQPLLGVAGYADRRPKEPNTNDANRQQNRRIDVRVVMAKPKVPDEAISGEKGSVGSEKGTP